MLNEKIYQLIFDEISAFLPDGWNSLVVYLEYGENSYSFSFYVKINKRFIKCYDLPGISDEQLFEAFQKIDNAVMMEREKAKGELWTNMTMIVDNDGNMHTDFDYTNLTDCAYEYSKEWKSKYLK